jgi:hypothetical protein
MLKEKTKLRRRLLSNPSVTGLIPSFARRGRGGFDYFS